jgi:hypothetical protein
MSDIKKNGGRGAVLFMNSRGKTDIGFEFEGIQGKLALALGFGDTFCKDTRHEARGVDLFCFFAKAKAKAKARGAEEKKKRRTYLPTFFPFLRFFEIFRSDFRKYFYRVFELIMQRNGQKRD